jgi:hypothetical protein
LTNLNILSIITVRKHKKGVRMKTKKERIKGLEKKCEDGLIFKTNAEDCKVENFFDKTILEEDVKRITHKKIDEIERIIDEANLRYQIYKNHNFIEILGYNHSKTRVISIYIDITLNPEIERILAFAEDDTIEAFANLHNIFRDDRNHKPNIYTNLEIPTKSKLIKKISEKIIPDTIEHLYKAY